MQSTTFTAGQRVRAMTGAEGTVVDPAPPVLSGKDSAADRVAVAVTLSTSFGQGRPGTVHVLVRYHVDDLEALP